MWCTGFYQPRSNPDCYAVTIYCIKDWKTIFDKIEWKDFNGVNWMSRLRRVILQNGQTSFNYYIINNILYAAAVCCDLCVRK